MDKILKEIDKKNFLKKVNGFIVNHENIEENYDKYNHGVLDIFDHCLNENEAEELLFSFTEHNLKNEYKFIEFMKLAYELNNNECIIMNFEFKDIDSSRILDILNVLDYADKILFIEQLRKVKGEKQYHGINYTELIDVFTKLATREIYFPIFYFTKLPMIIVGNYDLSFPIFFKEKDSIVEYKEIAKECGLFIRSLEIKE